MINEEKIARINELANKKKNEGLTEEEAKERKALHKEYLEGIRNNLRAQLNAIEFIDEDSEDTQNND